MPCHADKRGGPAERTIRHLHDYLWTGQSEQLQEAPQEQSLPHMMTVGSDGLDYFLGSVVKVWLRSLRNAVVGWKSGCQAWFAAGDPEVFILLEGSRQPPLPSATSGLKGESDRLERGDERASFYACTAPVTVCLTREVDMHEICPQIWGGVRTNRLIRCRLVLVEDLHPRKEPIEQVRMVKI